MCSAQNCPGMEARSEGGCRWVQTELQRTAAPFLVRSHHPPARHCVRPSAVSGRKLKVAPLRTDPRTRRAVFSFVPAKPLPSAPRPHAGTRRARASAPTEAPPFLPYAGRWSTWCLATKENRGKEEALPLTRRTRARPGKRGALPRKSREALCSAQADIRKTPRLCSAAAGAGARQRHQAREVPRFLLHPRFLD